MHLRKNKSHEKVVGMLDVKLFLYGLLFLIWLLKLQHVLWENIEVVDNQKKRLSGGTTESGSKDDTIWRMAKI